MKRSKFSEEQVVAVLRQGQSGISVKAMCAKHNISEPTYYKWKQKCGGLEVNYLRKMRAMAEEISQLKRIVADLVLKNDILKAVNTKKW